jgi:hypothetical protein
LNGQVKGTGQCGVYRNYAYYLLDQAGQRILQAYTVTETFTSYTGPFSPPTGNTSTVPPGLALTDIQSVTFPSPQCVPAGLIENFDLGFFVTSGARNFPLSTIVHIRRGRNIAGTLLVDATITTP